MNWKNLFVPVRNLSAGEARKYMEEHKSGAYQLLDVRQPKEYEAGHLPGAMLVPLKELPDRLDELDRNKPTIVYCAIGGRSKVAAQLLAGKDFASVFNLSGGIKAWEGRQATGPEEAGLEFFTGREDFADGVSLAYAMEEGLQEFYRLLAARAEDAAQAGLYTRLAGFEERHKSRLLAEYEKIHGPGQRPDREARGLMEGGQGGEEFLKRVQAQVENPRDILELAMTLETQAMDLYGRMARKSDDKACGVLFLDLVDEEQRHLAFLAAELDKVLE